MLTSFAFIRRALGVIWTASARWTVASAVLMLVLGILPAASVILTKRLVDALQQSIGAGSAGYSIVIVPGMLMLAVLIGQRVLGSVSDWIDVVQTQLVQDHVKALIHAKSTSIDYGFFESPEYHDQLHQANSQASNRVLGLLKNFSALGQSAVTFISISIVLIKNYSVWLPVLLLVTSLPAFLVVLAQNRRHHRWWKETTTDRRWNGYFDSLLTAQQAAAEIRLNDLGEYFTAKHETLVRRLRKESLHLASQRIRAKVVAGLIALATAGVAVVWIASKAVRGEATLGDLAALYQSFSQGQSLASTLLSSMGDIQTNVLFLEQVFAYLDTKNVIKDPEHPVAFPSVVSRGIVFDDVTFTYEDSEWPAVSNLRLEVPAGQIVAIVGANGSGKSTLIKLLCRFYDPDGGRITVDGVDVRETSQKELRRQIAVMFQFPVRYHLTAGQNIEVGDLKGAHDLADLERAARGAGAHDFVARLPNQYDTLLGRTFKNSAELSGGQWQRLALARAFLRQAQIVVLDEPTSFMDSWAELDWLQRFRSLVEGRTALIITHRFTTAMQADIIHVMDRGRIVESGTHSELLALGGTYAASWTEQVRAGASAHERPADVALAGSRPDA